MKKNSARLLALLLSICLLCSFMAMPAHAAQAPAETSNLGDYEYTYARWANPIKSYLVAGSDGTVTRVEYTGEAVAVETYSPGLAFVSGRQIAMELPLFGGFYSGSSCNFLVFGQENPNQDDALEVIRVVSYTKSWERIGSASLYGANTTIPFDAGSLRFAEYGGYLYIRTAHEMYMSSDGKNHQANLTMNVRISDMVITDSFYDVMNIKWGYVSHSFNQFIAVDGTDLVAVDHGDASPRSVVLLRYNAPAGQDSFMEYTLEPVGDGYYTYVYGKYVEVLPIAGNYGDNDTGVSLGGFACSDSAYLIAGNTVSQGDDYDPDGQRNIFISVTAKDNFTQAGTTIRYLTGHTSGVTVSNPHFVRVADNKYMILWTESGSQTSGLRYAFVDGNGQLIGQIYTAAGVLSDCQPVVANGKLIWYVTNVSAPAFFTIDLDDPATVTHDHVYTYAYVSYPSYSYDGALSSSCAICGQSGPNVVIPAVQNSEEYTLARTDTEPTCTEQGYGYFLWKDLYKYGVTNYIFGGPIDALGHSYVDGTCSVCGAADPDYVAPVEKFDLAGMTMSLGNSLAANFIVFHNDSMTGTNNYAVIEKAYADGTTQSVTIPQSQWQAYGAYGYYFTYAGVSAKEMTDQFTVNVYNADDVQIMNTYTRTIEDYCYDMLVEEEAKSDVNPEALALYVDILKYGAAAQAYFDAYNIENLATARLSEAQLAYGAQEVTMENIQKTEDGFLGATLSLKSEISMNFVYGNTVMGSAAYATISFTNHYGELKEQRVEAAQFGAYGTSGKYVVVDGMAVADCSAPITVTLYNADDNVITTTVDSVESYICRMGTADAVYPAIMKLANSAYNFFH